MYLYLLDPPQQVWRTVFVVCLVASICSTVMEVDVTGASAVLLCPRDQRPSFPAISAKDGT